MQHTQFNILSFSWTYLHGKNLCICFLNWLFLCHYSLWGSREIFRFHAFWFGCHLMLSALLYPWVCYKLRWKKNKLNHMSIQFTIAFCFLAQVDNRFKIQMEVTGHSLKFTSREGQLGNLELIGSNAVQLLGKILQPVSWWDILFYNPYHVNQIVHYCMA